MYSLLQAWSPIERQCRMAKYQSFFRLILRDGFAYEEIFGWALLGSWGLQDTQLERYLEP